MASYSFNLTDKTEKRTLKLKVTKNILFPHEWVDLDPGDNCLLVGRGIADDSKDDKVICHTGPPDNAPIMTFKEFHWNRKVGDTGGAVCDGCDSGCSPDWQWTLADIG